MGRVGRREGAGCDRAGKQIAHAGSTRPRLTNLLARQVLARRRQRRCQGAAEGVPAVIERLGHLGEALEVGDGARGVGDEAVDRAAQAWQPG